jgi:hypothetical protein
MLSHVSVDLEERNVAQVWAGDLEDIGTIFGKNPTNYRASDDSAELQHLYARQDPL